LPTGERHEGERRLLRVMRKATTLLAMCRDPSMSDDDVRRFAMEAECELLQARVRALDEEEK
jgi:hypothetical protein